MTSVRQHTVATTVTSSLASTSYHGAAWTHDTPIGSDISPDVDGVYPNTPAITVDLSMMLSRILGKQMPMDAVYRVTGIRIGLVNVDDADDNDRGMLLGGYIYYHSPTKHKIDAMQAAEAIERASEEGHIDPDAFFMQTARRYQGFRFGWNDDLNVLYQTDAQAVSDWAAWTGDNTWSMYPILNLYAQGLQDYHTDRANTLWEYRTASSEPSMMRFLAGFRNANMDSDGINATVDSIWHGDYIWQAAANRHIEVMGGLLLIEARQSNTHPSGDISPDDYNVQVEVTVEGWKRW